MSTVFLSSTSRDLRHYRDAAFAACRELGLAVVGMEDFQAMEVGATAASLAQLDRADVYLGIFAHRYGFVEPGYPASVTELEFDHALQRGLDCLCFLVDPNYPWPDEDIEHEQLPRLERLKERLRQGRIVRTFRSPEDMLHQVYRALESWLGRTGVRPRGPRQLPAPPADFVGRVADLEELERLLGGGATITGVHGLGGVGKTALALKLAERLALRHRDGQIFFDLQGARQPRAWQEAMGHVIHAFLPEQRLPESEAALAGLYRTVLSGKRVLLLLDDAAEAGQVRPLLPPAGCTLLVTSRRRFVVEGLVAHDLDTLAPMEAVALLRSMASRLDEASAAAIVEECGRLPLAVRLAGAALAVRKDLAAGAYLARLRAARLRELDGVAASIRLSEEQLPAVVRDRWPELAVLVGGFEASWAAAVWDVEAAVADDYLGTLLGYSLLDWDADNRLYHLHDLVRDYAGGHLEGAARADAERRHAVHFRNVLDEADTLYKRGSAAVVEAVELFERAWANAQAGFAWAERRAGQEAEAARLCVSYPHRAIYLLQLRQHPQVQIAWLQAALQAAREINDRRGEGNALGNLGLAYADLGQPQQAIEFYQQQLAITRDIGDRRGEGAALGNLGIAFKHLGQPQLAINFHEEALATSRAISDRRAESQALCNLGNAYYAVGQVQRAIDFYQQQLAITRDIGDRRSEGNALCNLGIAYSAIGKAQLAIDFYQRHLAIARDIGDRQGEAKACWNLGLQVAELGPERLAEAIDLMVVYVRFLQEIDHPDADTRAAYVNELRQRLAAGDAASPP
jgi:tetratricopeptide (TPR) repeat protein